MKNMNFLKVVCETVSPFGKQILIDQNCKDVNELLTIFKNNKELFSEDNTWVIYPMSFKI